MVRSATSPSPLQLKNQPGVKLPPTAAAHIALDQNGKAATLLSTRPHWSTKPRILVTIVGGRLPLAADGREICRGPRRMRVLAREIFRRELGCAQTIPEIARSQPRGDLSIRWRGKAIQRAKSTEYRGRDTAKGLWAARRIVWTGKYNALADPVTFLARAVDLEWD